MPFVCFNGTMVTIHDPLMAASNNAWKYGDGLFETMLVVNGKVPLGKDHMIRLLDGMECLHYQTGQYNADQLLSNIYALCEKNDHQNKARVRLSVFRTDTGFDYLIESFAFKEEPGLNEKGWTIGVCPDVKKQMDHYSNLKTTSYLPNLMAGRFAESHQWNEALVLNSEGFVCEGSRTNVFISINHEIITPSLNQGCVNGVMRRLVIELLKTKSIGVCERPVSLNELHTAQEVFLTNALRGVRWVKQMGNTVFTNRQAQHISGLVWSTILS